MSFCFPEEPDRLARKANRTEVCPYRQPTSAASEHPLVKIRSDRETSGKILDFRGQVHGTCWLFLSPQRTPTPILGAIDQVCSQGISLHIAANDEEMVIVLNRKALVSLLINMAEPTGVTAPVEGMIKSASFVRSGCSWHG